MLLLLFLLSLKGSLSQPSIYQLHIPASVTVQEGLCVNIPCNFSHAKSSKSLPFGSWLKDETGASKKNRVATNKPNLEVQEKSKGRFHFIGNPEKNNCSLYITDAQKGDSGKYVFQIEGGKEISYSYKGYKFNLNVTALTEKPIIYIPETLQEDQLVTLICIASWICREGTPPIFSWTGPASISQRPTQDSPYFSELSFIPKLQDHGTSLTCQMTFPGANVNTETTVWLRITSKTKRDSLTFFKGALLGSGIMALAFCLILACAKFLRKKKQVEDPDFLDKKEVNCNNQILKGVPVDQQRHPNLPRPSPSTQAPSEELYYATINVRTLMS